MKGILRMMVIFLLFFLGTTAMVHVDRECARMNRMEAKITIEKYAYLL